MTYALGQPVPLQIALTDANGQPANAASVVLTITLPDGTTATPAVTNPSTGTYRCDYLPATAGLYEVRWVLAGTNAAAPPVDIIDVRPASGGAVVSLVDLRAHMNRTTIVDDAELLRVSTEATSILMGELGRPTRRLTYTDTRRARSLSPDCDRGSSSREPLTLALRMTPCACAACRPYRLLTVTSVVAGGVTLDPSTYSLDEISGVLRIWSLYASTSVDVVITYVAGYAVLPEWLPMAVKRLTEHLWTRSQQARHTRGGAEPSEARPSAAYLLPYAVESLIAPHCAGSA